MPSNTLWLPTAIAITGGSIQCLRGNGALPGIESE
jgi:hypothetical protein